MQKIIKLALFLAVISALSGMSLSFVNDMTSPIIMEQGLAAEKSYLEGMYPGETFDVKDIKGEKVVKEYTTSKGGKAYKIEGNGYGGKIVAIIGFDGEGKIIGYDVIDCSTETKGFGSKVGEEPFISDVKSLSAGDTLDTISGATISSTVISQGFTEASELYSKGK